MKKLLLISTALVAFGVSPADAGPVAAVVSWVGGAIASGGIAGAIMQAALGIGANMLATALAGKQQGPSTSVQMDVEYGDDTALNFIVGKYATAGKLKYRGSWGKNTRFITEVFEVSCMPQGFSGVWIDDEIGEFNGNTGYVTSGSSPSSYKNISPTSGTPSGSQISVGSVVTTSSGSVDSNRVWVKWMDGTQTASDEFLQWAFGSGDYPWTSAHIGTGKTYAIVTVRYEDDNMNSKPEYMFEPDPLPMYDPRKDASVGGVGSHTWGDITTYEPTTNAAVIAYNLARGVYYGTEWVYGGKNLDAWRLPLTEWVAAMNACDATVTLSSGDTEAAYRCGANVTVDTTAADMLEEIGRAANMRFAEVGGKLKPIIDVPTTAVLGITDDDIITTEGQSLTPFLPISDTYNALSATYPEPDEKWSTKDAAEYIDTDATADDGGRYLPTSIEYAACPYPYQVQRLMRSQMRDYRRMRQHQFYLPPDAYALEPLVDCVSWTSDRNGYDNKLFLVTNVSKTPGMNVLVTLSEIDPADYDWNSTFEQDVTVIAPRPAETTTQTITDFAVTGVEIEDDDGASRRTAIQVSCDTDEEAVTYIRVQARLNGYTSILIDETLPFSDGGPWYLHNVIGGQTYDVRGELLSSITPISEWSPWVSVTPPIVGYTGDDIAAEAITHDKINVASFSAAGLALFGGGLQSDDYVSGSTGWAIDEDGDAEFNSMAVRSWFKNGELLGPGWPIDIEVIESSNAAYQFKHVGTVGIYVIGAGGGGAIVNTLDDGGVYTGIAQGGAAGGFARKTVVVTDDMLSNTYSVTVGAGGAARTISSGNYDNRDGNNGGVSSFYGNGLAIYAYGGAGGNSAYSQGTASVSAITGGTATGGDVNNQGGGVSANSSSGDGSYLSTGATINFGFAATTTLDGVWGSKVSGVGSGPSPMPSQFYNMSMTPIPFYGYNNDTFQGGGQQGGYGCGGYGNTTNTSTGSIPSGAGGDGLVVVVYFGENDLVG